MRTAVEYTLNNIMMDQVRAEECRLDVECEWMCACTNNWLHSDCLAMIDRAARLALEGIMTPAFLIVFTLLSTHWLT